MKNQSNRIIKLSEYIKPTYKKLHKLQQEILHSLGEKTFEVHSMQDFRFEVLTRIDITRRSIKNNEISIEKNADKVLKILGFKKAVLVNLKFEEEYKKRFKEKTVTEEFDQLVTGIGKPPYYELKDLNTKVKRDLIEINNLIKFYESTDSIQNFLTNGGKPQDQSSRTKFDFYLRCIKQRQLILDYYLSEMYKDAVVRSKVDYNKIFRSSLFSNLPYDFSKGLFRINYDSENIDLAAHRIGHIYVDEIEERRILYSKNKEKFYRILFKEKKD